MPQLQKQRFGCIKKEGCLLQGFLAVETHKFRAALGKSKMVKLQDKALVAYSGSQSSVTLLHLLHSGVTEEQYKKFLFSVSVLYIDEGCLLNIGMDERRELVEDIKNKLEKDLMKFEFGADFYSQVLPNWYNVFCYRNTNMSAYKRVQQWATFSRVWYLYDAKWQNPFHSAELIAKYLTGLHKPIYHSLSNCGDHVVVINCKQIALPGDEWRKRVYFHHTGRPGSDTWTLAWELHKKDPCMIMNKAVYAALPKNLLRRGMMQRLHLYDEEKVPAHILDNVTGQISQLRRVPRKLSSYTEQEIKEFPKLEDYKESYILKKL